MRPKVSLAKGDDRYENIRRALSLIDGEIDLQSKRRVLIKPNFVSTSRQLSATHVDAVRAVLDFLREQGVRKVTIGEGGAIGPVEEGYSNFGYERLKKEYDVELVDLNRDAAVVTQGYDRNLRPIPLRLARTVVESDFRISVTPPKTHDVVIVTASIKNMAVGSLVSPVATNDGPAMSLARRLVRLVPPALKTIGPLEPLKRALIAQVAGSSDKIAIHQGYHGINLNLYLLARKVMPHLSVIDGFTAMEGRGPCDGDPVDMRIAIASTDAVAADSLAAFLMGFDPSEIGYLWYCAQKGLGIGDLVQMEIIGENPKNCQRKFKPHPLYQDQLQWRNPGVEKLL